MGSTEIKVPRDRAGTFEPKIVPKHGRMTDEIQQRVIAMYAQGMTTRDIAAHVRELYHFSASENFVSDLVSVSNPNSLPGAIDHSKRFTRSSTSTRFT